MENNGMQPPQQPTPQGSSQPTQPVMDIQPPRPATTPGWPTAAPAPASGVGSAASAPAATSSNSAPSMASAPASWGSPASAVSPAPSTPPASPMNDMSVRPNPTPVTAPPDQPSHDKQPEQQKSADHGPVVGAKHKAPIGVIIGAIVVALLLAAVAVFAYMKAQKSPATPAKVNIPTIGVSDVNETEKQLESSLDGVDDTKDFATADLSDAALGL